MTEDTASWHEFADTNKPIITRAGKLANIALYIPASIDKKTPYASPLYAQSLEHLPPTLVITGECDPQRDEGEAYAERLRAFGIPVTHSRYPGMIHGFFQFASILDASRQLIDQMATTLKTALG